MRKSLKSSTAAKPPDEEDDDSKGKEGSQTPSINFISLMDKRPTGHGISFPQSSLFFYSNSTVCSSTGGTKTGFIYYFSV